MVDYKYKDLFLQSHVDKQLKIAADDGSFTATNSDIHFEDFELTESLCSDSELRFGSCEASMVKFQIRNAFIPLAGKWLTVTETLDGNTDVPFQYGRYKVFSDVPTADKEYRDITAYDAMYDILNADMAAWYKEVLPKKDSTMTLRKFRKSFMQNFGLEEVLPEGGLVNDTMTVERTIEPEQISGKDVITAICEINGCFGHIGRDGKFHCIYLPQAIEGLYPANDLYPDHAPEWMAQTKTGHLYPQNPNSTGLGTGRYIKCQYEDYRTKRITKLQIREKENDIGKTWPEGDVRENDNCYIIQDNFMVYGKSADELAVIAQNILEKITDIIYRPFNCTAVGNPCLEVGDPVRLPTKYEIVESYVLKRTLKGIQTLRDSYSADGVEKYVEKLNSVQNSIIQLEGKSNKLTRTIEETRLEMVDMGEGLSNTISVTAREIRGELQDEVDGLNTTINATAGEIRGELQDTKNNLETTISATAAGIRTDVSKTYETRKDASTEYTSIRNSLSVESDRLSSEINRATNAESNISGELATKTTQLNSKIEQTESAINLSISQNIAETKEYADTQATNAKNAANTATDNKLKSYSTTSQMNSAISVEIGKIEATVSNTYEKKSDAQSEYRDIRSTITQTENSIRTDVSETYETKSGASTQYNSLSSSISQTSSQISAEVNRATAAEGSLSSQIQLLAGQIVLKADANGRMVLVALNANPATGSEFKVDADNISLSANDVMNLMAGGTLNLSAKNISISSNNFSVDSQGNVVCNNLSAVTFTGRAINDLNNAIWKSETMKKVNNLLDMIDKKIFNIESVIYNDKTLFDTLDAKTDAYSWSGDNSTVIDGNWMKASPGSSLSSYTVVDASGYNKIICRIYAVAHGDVGGPHIANHFNINIGATNDPASAVTVLHKADNAGGGAYEGAAKEAWYNLEINVSGFTSKTSIPINVFYSRQASPSGGWRLYCSRITLSNN